ncbi:MAG: SDR family oxidoreductase [Pseudohongiellaceae bacterium]|jgi:NAD(P)-dependent dehydrogenase (short-subunit alcohol dehydrogenase family)
MQTIVITGANRGIGLALVRTFLQAGDHVIAACRAPDKASALTSLQQAGQSLEILPLEVTDASSIGRFAAELRGRRIDVLVNNAGVMGGPQQELRDMDYAAWLRTFEVNTLAPFHLSVRLLDSLARAPRPRIVTLSSQMGAFGRELGSGRYAYRSSKTAVSKVMQVLANELRARGVIVCPVHPGWVKTDMGGAAAEISPEESAAGLHRLIEGLTLEQSGRFWTWDGREHVW